MKQYKHPLPFIAPPEKPSNVIRIIRIILVLLLCAFWAGMIWILEKMFCQ